MQQTLLVQKTKPYFQPYFSYETTLIAKSYHLCTTSDLITLFLI